MLPLTYNNDAVGQVYARTCDTVQSFDGKTLSSVDQVLGLNDALSSSACVFKVAQGWDENVWVDARPVTTLAWRLAGGAVTCHWGVHRDRKLSAMSVALQPKGTPNHYLCKGPIHFAQLYLTDTLIDSVADSIRPGSMASGTLREDLSDLHDRDLAGLLSAYLATASTGGSKLEVEAHAILISAHLLRQHHGYSMAKQVSKGGLAGWQLRVVCDKMEADLGRDFSLEELAREVGISATHFNRAFKQSTGMPPFAWLAQRRMESAKQMLLDPTLPISQIALSLGFSAQAQFTTAFKRLTGTTPGVWRRRGF